MFVESETLCKGDKAYFLIHMQKTRTQALNKNKTLSKTLRWMNRPTGPRPLGSEHMNLAKSLNIFLFQYLHYEKQDNNICSADFIQRLFVIKWDKICIGALKDTTCPKMYIPPHLSSELGAGVGGGRVEGALFVISIWMVYWHLTQIQYGPPQIYTYFNIPFSANGSTT